MAYLGVQLDQRRLAHLALLQQRLQLLLGLVQRLPEARNRLGLRAHWGASLFSLAVSCAPRKREKRKAKKTVRVHSLASALVSVHIFLFSCRLISFFFFRRSNFAAERTGTNHHHIAQQQQHTQHPPPRATATWMQTRSCGSWRSASGASGSASGGARSA